MNRLKARTTHFFPTDVKASAKVKARKTRNAIPLSCYFVSQIERDVEKFAFRKGGAGLGFLPNPEEFSNKGVFNNILGKITKFVAYDLNSLVEPGARQVKGCEEIGG
jgi:hypothetical protein